MKKNIAFKGNYAVSEVVGGMILVLVAVITFSAIYIYLFPPAPDYDAGIKIEGFVNDDGLIILEHVGGNTLDSYRVVIRYPNCTYLGSKVVTGDHWKIGEYRYPLENITDIRLVNDSIMLKVAVYSFNEDGSKQEIFTWDPCGETSEISSNSPILISSLKTNVVDEDLICYSYPVIPDINDTTSYIYNWKVNGVGLMCLNMPFDTENNATCKDYSGCGIVGQLYGPLWTPNGVVGGAYYFDGSSEYITMSLPNVFYDIPNNDFTISMWVKSNAIAADNAVVLMASKNNQNFVKVFLFGDEVHIGVCCDGVKDAVRTEDLLNGTWYHIAAVWDANEKLIKVYCNGEEFLLAGERNFALGAGAGLFEIGHGTASSKFWDGYMDQFEVYNKALSNDQIYQIYLSTKDGQYDRRLFVSEETNVGETWQCIVTPNNTTQDGTQIASNILKIVNYIGGD